MSTIKQSIVLKALEQKGDSGLTPENKMLEWATAEDFLRMDNRMDILEKKVDDIKSDVADIKVKLDALIASNSVAFTKATKYDFLKELFSPTMIKWYLFFVIFLLGLNILDWADKLWGK